jgi:hypothetical protein
MEAVCFDSPSLPNKVVNPVDAFFRAPGPVPRSTAASARVSFQRAVMRASLTGRICSVV